MGALPSREASGSLGTGRGALPTESALADSSLARGSFHRIRAPKPTTEQPVEFCGSTLWSHPLASKRFHVLLNSLFKVLFNFPSRYLFSIRLVPIFSLRWSLPPTLGCIPKQPDSKDTTRDSCQHHRGLTPAMGKAPIRRTQMPATVPSAVLNTTAPPSQYSQGDSVLGYSHFTRRYYGNPS